MANIQWGQRPARITEPVRSDVGDGSMLTVTPAPTYGPSLLEVLLATSAGADLVSAIRAVRARRAAAGREPADDGTSVVTAAEDEGNAVIVVHSNSFPQFASGIVTLCPRQTRRASCAGDPTAPSASADPGLVLVRGSD